MNQRPVNYFSPKLRELVEADEYLSRVQNSLAHKNTEWRRRGFDNAAYIVKSNRARIIEIRKSYLEEMIRLGEDVPIVRSATGVRGIGCLSFLRIAVRIDIVKADTPAKLWRYCGYGLRDNLSSRLAAMNVSEITYNGKVRRALGGIIIQLMHPDSPYRREYETYLARQIKSGVRSPVASSRGKRYIIKLWLKHLWRVWRRLEGLPYTNHHPDDKTTFASDYGWL